MWLLRAPTGTFSPLFHLEGVSYPFLSILGHLDKSLLATFPLLWLGGGSRVEREEQTAVL